MIKKTERLNHITYWQQSGQTKKAYCEIAGIKYATFISWFKNEKEVVPGSFVKLKQIERISGLEIVFPNGIRLYSSDVLTLDLLKSLQSV